MPLKLKGDIGTFLGYSPGDVIRPKDEAVFAANYMRFCETCSDEDADARRNAQPDSRTPADAQAGQDATRRATKPKATAPKATDKGGD